MADKILRVISENNFGATNVEIIVTKPDDLDHHVQLFMDGRCVLEGKGVNVGSFAFNEFVDRLQLLANKLKEKEVKAVKKDPKNVKTQ